MRKGLRRAPVASVEKSICPLRRGSTSENSVRTENNWFRINRARAPVAQLDRASAFEAGNQTYQILPEPTQPARKQQVVTNRGKPFSPSFFAFCVQFIRTFQHLYYVFTTFEWLASRVRARHATSQPELTGYSCFSRF